jgi:uncharacterized membrane protein YeaQ/YmgE (transglycosylase-associated protein family)
VDHAGTRSQRLPDIIIGMVGVLIGGFVKRLFGGVGVTGFNVCRSWWPPGAVILLAIYYRLIASG